jgi:fibro-slime domain-containing protein
LPAAEQAAETAAQPDGQQPETAIPETIIEEAVPPAGSAQAPQAGTEAGATEYAQSEAPTAPATEAEQAAAGADSPSIATAAPAQAEPSAPEATEPAAASAADSADSLGEGAATAEQAAPVTEEAAPTEQSAPAQEQGQPSGDSGLLAYIGSLYVPAAYANAEGLEPAEGGAAAPAADPADAAIAPEASAVPEAGPDAENTAPGGGAAENTAEEAPAGIPAGDAAAEAPADAQGAAPELAGDSAEGDGAAAIGDAVPEEAADLPDGLVPEGAGTVSTLVETPIEINLDLNPLGEKVEIAAAPSVVTVLETKVLPAEPEPKPAQAVQAAQAVASLLKEAATGQSAVYAAYGDAVAGDIMYLPVNMYDYLGMQTGQMTGTFNHNMYLGGGDIATSYADSYQMRNLYFGVFTAPNSAALGRQNASTRVNNISQGVTLGIANPTLAQDASGKYEFALSSTLGLTTYNNAKLFPNTIADANTAMVDPRFGLQFPFVKGSDGFYRFDSDSSHVLVRDATAGNGYTMVLREGAQTSAGGSGPGWGGNTDLRTGGVGWFPFDTAAQTAAPNHNLYFGMSLDIPFVMPLDGIIGGEDMKFEFEGDDDIWIYIDGKLALDLGGKHDKEGGTINFATGLITVNHAAGRIPANINGALTGPTGDLYWNLYDAANAAVLGATLPAGKTIQGSLGIDRSTLSQHTLSMYFMERGGYGSNCNIKFNLPTFEPDKLNVFKFADAFTNPDEEFVFDAYKWNGDGAPLESDEGILSATEILKKDESFTVDVDYTENGGQWVRIVERPATVGSSEEEHSTITVREGAGTKSGKDSGWFWCPYQATKSLFFVNYKQKPIEIVKYRLDGASVGASGGTAYRTMAGVEFELYKYENGTATIVSNSLTTASDGRIYLNAKHIAGSPQILPDTEYCLVEKAPEYYEEAPEIYFSTTDGASPRVKDLWYYEGTGAGRTRIPDEKGLEQNTQLAFASENGVEIRIYNRREEGGLTIEKTIDEFYQTQGKPAFVFEVEKFPIAVDGEGNVVPGEEKLPGARMAIVDFGDVMDGSESNTRIAEIGGLDAGYFYRVSELGAMRYEQEGATLEGADDVDESGNTVTFLLEGDSDAIIVRFENAHNGTGYLGDVEAKVNSFRLSALPEPSAPVVCKVTVKKTNAPTATYTFDMIAGEFLDLTAFPAGVINPASDGLIGTVVGGGNFYVHTPIPADGCTINLRVP